MLEIFDISIPLDAKTILYPGDSPINLSRTYDEHLISSHLSMGCHIGTHVDLPGHFLINGDVLEDYDVSRFVGMAIVLNLCGVKVITESVLKKLEIVIPKEHHIFLKTDNSALLKSNKFSEEYVYVDPGAAEFLLTLQPRSVGIDYYSLDPFHTSDFSSHKIMAEAGLPVFVCLDLGNVDSGVYSFAGLPLNLSEAEGVPVRAILWN